MNLDNFIKMYFNEEVQVEYSGLGLSNSNYYVNTKDHKYMLRIPNPLTTDIKNRMSEAQALTITKDCSFSLHPVYYNSDTGILMSDYLDNACTYQECNHPNKIEMVAGVLKELHSLNKNIDETFHPIEKYESFANKVKQPLFPTKDYEYILQDLPSTTHLTLCHNDVVDGNLLFVDEKLYLIDFEYAASNDPLFDIMSFFSENQIMDHQLRERFYKAYFGDDEIPYTQLHQWENYQNLLWCTWAMMMWELHDEDIYKEIAQWKFEYLSK